MSVWRQVTRGLRTLLHPGAADRDAQDEAQHYLDEAAAAHRARGLSPEQASRAASLELGGLTQVREQLRTAGWEQLIESGWSDLRHAMRRLGAEPGFTTIAVITLALGTGASTAIFSVVNPILFRSLPYPAADRIVTVWDRGSDGARLQVTYGSFLELKERSHSLDAMAVVKPWQPTLTGGAEPERLEGQRVSWEYFRALGLAPTLGRDFQAAEDRPGATPAVLLSDGLWRRRFAADPQLIGRTIDFGGQPFEVIGVMPRGFENVIAPAAEIWAPLQYDLSEGRAWGHHLRLIGRVRPAMAVGSAARELNDIAAHPIAEWARRPWASMSGGLLVAPLQEEVTRGVKPGLLAVLGAVALLLLIACVNVTSLLLARGVRRSGEFAVRVALGAGRGRLVRQLLTEHLLLAVLGGLGGVLVARLGVRALLALSPAALPRVGAIGVDGAALAFGVIVTGMTGLVFGSIAAFQAAQEAPQGTLHLASRRSSGGHRRARRMLVMVQVALALCLLVASGLLLRSLTSLFRIETGFAAPRLLTLQVQVAGQRFSDDSATTRFFADVLAAVGRVPGVSSAGLTSQLPLSGDLDLYGTHFDPSPAGDSGEVRGSFRYAVSPGYFETMGIPLRRGRYLADEDRAGAMPVAVISESMARRRLPGIDPIGQRIRIGEEWVYTIVGVVGDVKQVSLAQTDADAVYTSATQWHVADRVMSVVVRSREDAAALAPAIRQAVWSVDKDQPVVRVAMMEELVAASAADRRFALRLFAAFAVLALVLAAGGIYGALSSSVAERVREIGVRTALGASRPRILGLILREGMSLTALGGIIGLAGAAIGTRVIAKLLFAISPLDPLTYGSVILLLTAVALLACAVPAWRAARVDPVLTLRSE